MAREFSISPIEVEKTFTAKWVRSWNELREAEGMEADRIARKTKRRSK